MSKIKPLHREAVKPKHADAFRLINQLRNGEILNEVDVDSLMLFFAPAPPRKARTAEEWVAKAVNPKDHREYLHFVRVLNGYAMATDGHRVHTAPTDLINGWYDPKTLLRVDVPFSDDRFPQIYRVIPNCDEMASQHLANLGRWSRVSSATEKKPFDWLREAPSVSKDKLPPRVTELYLKHAVNGDEDKLVGYREAVDTVTVRDTFPGSVAVIMPTRY